jgi:tetratricopeptide (TPR) repeat protein
MTTRLTFALTLALGLLIGAAGARAQDDSLNRAREAFDKGQLLFEQAQYEAAADQFIAAHAARPFAAFLYNAGLSYEKAQRYDKAVEYYRRYLASAPDAGDKAEVEARIAAIEKAIERRAATPPSGEAAPAGAVPEEVQALGEAKIRGLVVIESKPQGAYVYLDDKKKEPLGRTPWNGTMEGEHTVFIEAQGYKPEERKVSAVPEKVLVLFFSLAEEDYLGWIDIRANVPNADIYIDDKIAVFRQTPYSGNLKPGKHKIWISKQGYDEYATEIEIIPGQTHEVRAELSGGEVGYLNVRGRDVERVKVFVDGAKVCDGPCRHPLAAGSHRVSIERSGFKTYSRMIAVQPKTETTIRPALAPEPSRADAMWAYAFAAAFTGGGVYLGLQAKDLEDEFRADIDAGTPPPDGDDPRVLRGKLFAIGADVAYTVGAATFLTAVYYTFRDKGQPSTASTDVSSIALAPRVSPDFAGIGMEVSW